jgi:hypothetical protein
MATYYELIKHYGSRISVEQEGKHSLEIFTGAVMVRQVDVQYDMLNDMGPGLQKESREITLFHMTGDQRNLQ